MARPRPASSTSSKAGRSEGSPRAGPRCQSLRRAPPPRLTRTNRPSRAPSHPPTLPSRRRASRSRVRGPRALLRRPLSLPDRPLNLLGGPLSPRGASRPRQSTHETPAGQRFHSGKNVGGSAPLVLVIDPRQPPRRTCAFRLQDCLQPKRKAHSIAGVRFPKRRAIGDSSREPAYPRVAVSCTRPWSG